MDRSSEKEKSSRKSREERDSRKESHSSHHEHHYKDRDSHRERERERDRHRSKDHHHRHGSEERDGDESGGDEAYHHYRNREPEGSKHRSTGYRRSKDEKVKFDDDDENGYRRSSGHSHERESRREYNERRISEERESRRERGGSRDRICGRDSERERSMEREGSRERSLEPSNSLKRKDREDEMDASEKRVKVSDDTKVEKKKRERGWFEEKPDGVFRDLSAVSVKEERGEETDSRKEGRREKRKFEDRDEARVVKNEDGQVEHGNGMRRERRKFEDREVKGEEQEEGEYDRKHFSSSHDNSAPISLGGSNANRDAMEPSASNLKNVAPIHPPSSKVSSIFTTNENKGVSITGSHEVTGKSSTDGAATVAGKSGNLSLDALAKAKKALQMQKELAQKLKNLPKVNKSANSVADYKEQTSSRVEPKSPSNAALLPTPPGQFASAATLGSLPSLSAGPSSVLPFGGMDAAKVEAVRRAQELAAKMGFHHDSQFGPLINLFPGQAPQETSVPQKPTKAPVLRLDALGREIDEQGNLVNVPKINNLSTLKVNINKQKKDAFQILKPELDVDPEQNPHFDPRMGIDKNKILRPKRMSFQFVEEGKWSKDAEIVKLKSQFGEAQAKELKAKQAQLAKAKAEPNINPNLIEIGERVSTKEKPKQIIPEVEWWDVPILRSGNYGDLADNGDVGDLIKTEKITIYIEHPRPIEPPAEPAPPPPQPLKLTKKEQKKLRTQRRLAREKERQEMIRQGLIEPPKPKVKMSNLMKVLGSEATQDPTRMEKEIRTAAAEREQAHIDRNIARKLTPAERREKKERKLFEDPNTLETIVSVYKINDLSHPQNRFKVDVNAQENRMTGCAVLFEGFSVVVVEGGSKAIKRYGKLMLRRINWAAKLPSEEEDDEDEDRPPNKCSLVWQGSVAKPSFNRFSVHECRTEAAARKVFADVGVGHYWDLASNFTDIQD